MKTQLKQAYSPSLSSQTLKRPITSAETFHDQVGPKSSRQREFGYQL